MTSKSISAAACLMWPSQETEVTLKVVEGPALDVKIFDEVIAVNGTVVKSLVEME